jgi:hypothetical protein
MERFNLSKLNMVEGKEDQWRALVNIVINLWVP